MYSDYEGQIMQSNLPQSTRHKTHWTGTMQHMQQLFWCQKMERPNIVCAP